MMSRAQSTSERLARPYEVQYETTVKTILRLEEEDDEGVTTVREKERFSHCLNLLFMDGRTEVLTADAPAGEDDKPACNQTASTQAIAHAAVAGVADMPRTARKFRIEEA